jgi:ribosomal protein L7/L12
MLCDLVRLLEKATDQQTREHLAKAVMREAVIMTGMSCNLMNDEKQCARNGRKLAAIKLMRQRTASTLLECKRAVEQWMDSQGIS